MAFFLILQVGIRRLINNHTYTAVFPLHEGCYDRDEYDQQGELLDRRVSGNIKYCVKNINMKQVQNNNVYPQSQKL